MIHPPGTIALPVGELGRFSSFAHSLACLIYPPGTKVSMMQSVSITRNLNQIVREMTGEWVWLMGDDHTFDHDLLIRLLDRDLDVVVPFCIRRRPPFGPVLFKAETSPGEYEPFGYDELPDSGLVEVFAAGTAGMLVRRHVIDAIGDPWFTTEGVDNQNEDLEFCRKIRAAGYRIYADMDCLMGHIGLFNVRPHRQRDEWGILFDLGAGPEGALNSIFVQTGARYITAGKEDV